MRSTGTIPYSNNWAGDRPADSAITYANNINGGTATARMQLHGKTLSTQYTIRPLSLMGPGGASLSPSSGTYTGQRHTPNITVYNPSYPNVTAKDYTMDVTWSPAEPINAGSYTARVVISGNYSGYWDVKYTINKANLTNVKVNVTPASTACGMPTVTASATSVGSQPVTFTYSTSENGTYTAALPTFASPGTHAVYYKASAPNHNDAVGSFQYESVSTPVTITGSSMRIPYVGGLCLDVSTAFTIDENAGEAKVTIGENTTYCITLAEAVNLAKTGTAAAPATLKLEKNINLGYNCLQIPSGVLTFDLNGKTLSGSAYLMGTLDLSGGDVTITDSGEGGTITNGNYAGVYADNCTLTIAGGINVDSTTLKAILDEGAAYWQGDKMVFLTEGQTSISGDVTVKAECKHENITYPESGITDTQHTLVCSCGYEETEKHTPDAGGYTVNDDGTHSFTCACGEIIEEHDYTKNDAHQCVCGDVEHFTLTIESIAIADDGEWYWDRMTVV